ncbi:hypothetical protein GCM10027059_15190 [Myceligenerans halotolerans]
MARKQSLSRTSARKAPRRVMVVWTEGEVTEPAYVNALKRLDHVRANTALSIKIAPAHTVPYPLVEGAIEQARDRDVDEVWCLMDVEAPRRHPRLVEVVALAARHAKVHLAFSNPCFEAWLLLHDRDLGGFLTTAEAVKAAQAMDGVNGKHVDAAHLVARRATASKRAQKARRRHEKDGVMFPGDNPASHVDLFLAAVEGPSGHPVS